MGAKRVSKQGVTVSTGNAIEVTDTTGSVLFSVDSTGSLNTLPNLTAKGSILTASAANTPAALAVGNSGETLVADSSASTGLRWQPSQAAGRNFAINGGFDFWQRGTSSTASGVYLADRWIHGRAGGATGATYTRQTATDSSTLPFLQYSFRLQRDSGNTSTAQLNLNQVIETANSLPLAGRTVTLSFYARVGANFSATSGTVNCYLFTGTGTDQNGVLGTWTGSANPLSANFTGATTTWQRFQATATLSNTTNEIYFGIGFTPTGTAGAADWLEIAGVQLEIGSIATTFSRAGGTLAGELAACQRYYYVHATGSTKPLGLGSVYNTGEIDLFVQFPVRMRTTPTLITNTGTNYYEIYGNGTGNNISSSWNIWAYSNENMGGIYTLSSGLTAGTVGSVLTKNASSLIAFNSEL